MSISRRLRASRVAPLAVPLAGTLLAYLLRTFSLDLQSFWLDEIQAFEFIDHPLLETIGLIISPEHNGPLYFLLLWTWRRVTGPSDFAVRYMSTLFSVLTVGVVWQLARTWFDRRVAGLSTLLLATSPFAIWFGQEGKMYALHMFLASLSTWFVIRAIRHRRWPLWLAYGVSINLLGYSHFFGAFTIAAQGLIVLATNVRSPKVLRSYITTMVIIALPYLPILRYALGVLPSYQNQDISKGFVTLPHMLQELASEYALRTTRVYVDHLPRLMLFVGVALTLGLWSAWRRGSRAALWFTGLLILPIALFYPVSYRVPVFSPKYLSATFLLFIIGLALAVDQLARWWRPLAGAGLAVLIGLNGWANVRILTNPIFQRSDFRATAAFLETHVKPDDAIVGFADYVHRAINRYYDGEAPVYRFKAKPYEPEEYYRSWIVEANDHHALWLVLHQDQAMAPHNRLQEGAAALFPQMTGVFPNNGNIAILGYSVRWRHDQLPIDAIPQDVPFDNGLALAGYEVDATRLRATDKLLHPPSNWIHVTTYWRLRGKAPTSEFTPLVQLVDDQGGVWGGELQRSPTVFHHDPPENWDQGTIVEAHYDVNLNPVTPPGTYHLIIGMRGDGEDRVLTVEGQPHAVLTEIEIIE
ncbi:MAG: glycosyltransferase family 39 protein [Anaerolineae bacterium]